jgi:hypothetical protein
MALKGSLLLVGVGWFLCLDWDSEVKVFCEFC